MTNDQPRLLEMEYDLLVEEIRPAFRGDGRGPSPVTNAHLEKLMRSVVREYVVVFRFFFCFFFFFFFFFLNVATSWLAYAPHRLRWAASVPSAPS